MRGRMVIIYFFVSASLLSASDEHPGPIGPEGAALHAQPADAKPPTVQELQRALDTARLKAQISEFHRRVAEQERQKAKEAVLRLMADFGVFRSRSELAKEQEAHAQTKRERDQALNQRDEALNQRDQALNQRDEALSLRGFFFHRTGMPLCIGIFLAYKIACEAYHYNMRASHITVASKTK